MIKFMCNGLEVEINLSNKIYQTMPESAVGKTYLCTILKSIAEEDILVISYGDLKFITNESVRSEVFSKRYKLIFIDRYDMYSGLLDEYLQRYDGKAVVIIDLKQESKDWVNHMCDFKLTREKLEVSEIW